MEQYNPEKIANEVEEREFGELAELSSTELFQLYLDAHNSTMDTQGVETVVLAVLHHRGIPIEEMYRD